MDQGLLGVTLLLDDYSRIRLKVNISELVMQDINVVSSLGDIKRSYLERSKIVLILEDFIKKNGNYSELKLYKKVFGINYIYIGLDDTLISVMSEIADCYKMDPAFLDYNRIKSVIHSDIALQSKYISDESYISESEKFALGVVNNSEYSEDTRRLADNYLALLGVLKDKDNQIESIRNLLDKTQGLLCGANEYKDELERMYFDLLTNSKKLNRSLKQYASILSKDVYDKVILSKYSNRPYIIYLKEYEELNYLNSLIETIFEMFRYQMRQSVKVLRLYDSSGSKKVLTIPPHYVKIQNKFKRSDVISNDFIVKTGNYQEVLDLILTNHNGLGVLIIVDCKDHSDSVLSGSYLHLSMCRNPSHLGHYGLDRESTIVNNDENNPMSWDHYTEYKKLELSERFAFLASRPVIQNIYELSKEFSRIG